MYQKILLPTDGSGYADEEIDRVTKLIADDGEIFVLSVAGKMTSSAFQSRSNVKKINKGMREEAKDYVDQMVKKFPEGYNVKGIVRAGFAAETIVKVAEENGVELIVISSSGKSGIHRFILGSVTEKVLKTADMDVLLVHNSD